VPQVPSTFPAIYGSEALLKVLSDEGERCVYLLAISGATKPWVLKMIPAVATSDPESLSAETKWLRRMESPTLAKVLDFEEAKGTVGAVMAHVHGKSLAAICDRAAARALLLPPELGAIVAYDAFTALAYFHEFEGAGRLHGNISPRTIMVGYSGDVKVVGFRHGLHPRVDIGVQVASDLKPLASILCDLPFRQFPQQLVQFIPRLLEETISPTEAASAVKQFLPSHAPTADERKKVASWLAEIFPGEQEKEAQEGQELLAAGLKLIATASAEKKGWVQNPAVGDEIGEYRIVEVLGEGGMGKVYEAESLKTAKRVALKVLHPKGRTSSIEERFRREAESILRIANPHVVDIERFGASADGKFLYLAMELIRGEPLDRVLHKEAPFAPLRALRIASQICQALSAAHESGVVHRDLKPGNVMLVDHEGDHDFVKVLDFGLARLDMAEAALTRVGDLIGTFAYMAPEQGQGKPATPKIDIYAVGELLYEMLTKRLPHEGSENILGRKASVEPVPITNYCPELPEDISRLVMKAIARNPDGRHTTMAELGQEIDGIIAQRAVHSPFFKRKWFKIVVGVTVASALAAVGVSMLMTKRHGQPTTKGERHETAPATLSQETPTVQPIPAPSPAEQPAPVETAPLALPANLPRPKAIGQEGRPAKHKAEESSVEQLLQSAEAAFESGDRKEAIRIGTQALKAGGGVRAHLALAGYYQSMRFFREALDHYQAALKIDPGNAFAAKGVEIVEKRIASGQ
jgi:serine/threonine-protein kinase